MIQSKQELIDLLSIIYESLNFPLFLIDQNKKIIDSPKEFIQLKEDYFIDIIKDKEIKNHKISTIFAKKEIYFIFPCTIEDIAYICIGPFLTQRFYEKGSPSSYSFFDQVTSSFTIQDLALFPYLNLETRKKTRLLYQIVTGQHITSEELKASYQKPKEQAPEVQDSIDNQFFEIREDSMSEYSYAFEQKLKKAIQDGNSVDARILANDFIYSKKAHSLSSNRLSSAKYNIVAGIALFTRYVIEVGVPVMKAYSLSDIYIRKIDLTQNIDQLYVIFFDAIVDYTRMVKRYRDLQNPLWVKTCKEHIGKNLHQKITLHDLAELVYMNPNYLSVQFKKITGTSIKEYINLKKIEEAKFLLKTSHYTIHEISMILDFASQSHFTKTFKSMTSMTPLEYKNSK